VLLAVDSQRQSKPGREVACRLKFVGRRQR
jgi:hypothetical protein